ncbi:MAG: 2-oxoisovalerate dehydrogenase [Planctomycetota bacterium]
MNKELIFLVEESIEGGYEARALGYSIFTQAETTEELKKQIVDAVKCHFNENEMPAIIRIHLVKDEIIAV